MLCITFSTPCNCEILNIVERFDQKKKKFRGLSYEENNISCNIYNFTMEMVNNSTLLGL